MSSTEIATALEAARGLTREQLEARIKELDSEKKILLPLYQQALRKEREDKKKSAATPAR